MKPAFVILTDLSEAAETALTYTARLVSQLNGRLVLLHVYQDPLLEHEAHAGAAPAVLDSRKQIMSQLVRRVRRLAVPAVAELSAEGLGTAVAEVVRHHHPLLLALGREHPDTMLDRLIGHQALPILQAAHYPLLLVPEGWTDQALPSRVVVAADDRPFQLSSSSLALTELLAALKPTTTVVHVAAGAGASRADVGLEAVRRTELFGALNSNSLYEVREETPVEGILHAAADLQAQLIVVLARPHTFVGGLFHRSVTAQVMRRSPLPVLILPTTT
ncbi:Universal stress protein family protein [Hymenobacter daecheongensis DSM 21074]|uniref:Universal stress protein family protein n=1 Tax=Hymenobacter daecheongensis DSM 21074 TaxID=1121955 RepID=A0A1M6MDG0_9BACT|nr:universal stress protein [Hymenobacter daecheongensis]SHJ81501.1 Universal stress protein family protein [Hymenobacter daecheongensis DSM 21074]